MCSFGQYFTEKGCWVPLQEQRMNVFTESELITFFQVGSSNKGPSVGFVEVRGTPGDPVVLYFYCNYSV